MIKESIQEEDITIINIYAPNIGVPQYIRQMLTSMKGEINSKRTIVGDFNTPLTPMDRWTKEKISKETQVKWYNGQVRPNLYLQGISPQNNAFHLFLKCTRNILQDRLYHKYDINHSKILYDPPPKVMEAKAQINKWDPIKLISFFTTKETISKVKRQPSEWEKMKANETTDKELISKIYKPLMQLNTRKINDQIKSGPKI